MTWEVLTPRAQLDVVELLEHLGRDGRGLVVDLSQVKAQRDRVRPRHLLAPLDVDGVVGVFQAVDVLRGDTGLQDVGRRVVPGLGGV